MIRTYLPADTPRLLHLWNTAGVRMGFAPLSEELFRRLLTEHPAFSPEYTFLLEQKGTILGFINGCTGSSFSHGSTPGYLSCLILSEAADTSENTLLLLNALEEAFRNAGCTHIAATFFNPIRLPWVIPGTDNHQHNNAPGIAADLPLHSRMIGHGYRVTSRECAMYFDLSGFEMPCWVEEKAARMAETGFTVAQYDSRIHSGLEEMVSALNNSMWSAEIPAAGKAGMDLLVALSGTVCAGFAGPVYPEDTGRGYFAGIAVAPRFEKKGLGTLLFYRLLQREKEAGAQYMSLFTGEDSRARQIYIGAGFQTVRTFCVMRKEL